MITDEERAANVCKYWVDMGPQYAEQLERDRADLVARYLAAPQVWPDGLPAWYVADEWEVYEEKGVRKARRKVGIEVPPHPHDEARMGAYRAKVKAAKAVLAEVEARVGVKPVVVSEAGGEGRLPWVAAGLSRRTWYRRKARGEL